MYRYQSTDSITQLVAVSLLCWEWYSFHYTHGERTKAKLASKAVIVLTIQATIHT